MVHESVLEEYFEEGNKDYENWYFIWDYQLTIVNAIFPIIMKHHIQTFLFGDRWNCWF